MAGLGGFGAFFDLKAAGFADPILVATTDGVGTKLRVALAAKNHSTIGMDLVAMCVNDLIVQGAQPLLFLDYYATGKLDINVGKDIVSGIAKACVESHCALVGGETAEMPGHYQGEDYDLAGFAIGAVERGQALTGADVMPGDLILGLGSSGVHSNGFSLVRRIVDKVKMNYTDPAPFLPTESLGDALLVPTRIYVRSLLKVMGKIKALAHITGGGVIENIPRVLPTHCVAEIDVTRWALPPVFKWLKETGNVPSMDFARTFNCGIGMIVIVSPPYKEEVTGILEQEGEKVFYLGTVKEGKGPATRLLHLESWD